MKFEDPNYGNDGSGNIFLEMPDVVTLSEAVAVWRKRKVAYFSGSWDVLKPLIPKFATEKFSQNEQAPANPFLRKVVRLPRSKYEFAIPVGVVSPSYSLAQHTTVAEKCLAALGECGVDINDLKCEVGLSELGEWMNYRAYLPDEYSRTFRDGEKIGLRVECFNSVEGSCRLTIFFGWLRFICSNGLVIGDSKAELRDTHDRSLDLNQISAIVKNGMQLIESDFRGLNQWDNTSIELDALPKWVDTKLSAKWGVKAAARVYHLCVHGREVEFPFPFAPGTASEKPVRYGSKVPAAAVPVQTLYDVSQALSWVASKRRDPIERLDWQSQIPGLIRIAQALTQKITVKFIVSLGHVLFGIDRRPSPKQLHRTQTILPIFVPTPIFPELAD